MASSSLPNFLSFLLPTKTKSPPPPTKLPPSQVSLSSETRDNAVVAPLISSGLPPQALSLSASLSPAPNSDVMSVVCPSFAYANTLYCRPYNVMVVTDEDEDGEGLIQRFRREVMRAGIIPEAKRRRFHETNQEKAKRKAKEAAKRNSIMKRRTPFVPYRPPASEMEDLQEDQDEEDDDYWDGFGEPSPLEEVEEEEEEEEGGLGKA